MIFLAGQVQRCGTTLIGTWTTDGYAFSRSWAVEDGRFVGLVLDEHAQPELTEARLDRWARILNEAFSA